VTDAGVHYLGDDAIADCRESQNQQGDPHHAAAGPDAAALWEGAVLMLRNTNSVITAADWSPSLASSSDACELPAENSLKKKKS